VFTISSDAIAGGLKGRVIDAITQRIVADGTVVVLDRQGQIVAQSVTDEAGQYSIDTSYVGMVSVSVEADKYNTAVDDNVRLLDGKNQMVNFALSRTSRLESIVVKAKAIPSYDNGSMVGRVMSREEIRRAPGTGGMYLVGLISFRVSIARVHSQISPCVDAGPETTLS